MKKLIINCDDFGISKSANIAIIECLNKKKSYKHIHTSK